MHAITLKATGQHLQELYLETSNLRAVRNRYFPHFMTNMYEVYYTLNISAFIK